MNAIMGMTQLALAANPGAQQRNYLVKIGSAAKSLLGIVNDVLDFSKMEAGMLEFEEIPFSLADILKKLVDTLGFQVQEKGLELLFEVKRATAVPLCGDPLRIGQILLNLVNNAIKFTPSGRIVIKVEAESRDSPRPAELCRLRHRHRHDREPAGQPVSILLPG